MTNNGSTIDGVLLTVSAEERFADLTLVTAYENDIKPIPVSEPIVAFSTKGCVIGPQLTTTLDSGKIVATSDREVDTTISVDIYMPYSMGGSAAHKVYDRLATFLLYEAGYNIIKSVCNETEYDKSCQAIVLKSTFVFHEVVSS
ncbi:MAG: hypothetical protein IJZ16_08080 [Clostridia bacterium]|nr:hypothetical protein [Clostridia bacterium]